MERKEEEGGERPTAQTEKSIEMEKQTAQEDSE